MKQQKAQIIQLQPTEEQRSYFARASGTARFAFNWGLHMWNLLYRLHKLTGADKPSGYTVNSLWNAYKRRMQTEKPWLTEVASIGPKWALSASLPSAFKNWWHPGTKARGPKFKSKRTARRVFVGLDSCKPTAFRHRGIKLAKLGWVRCRSTLRWPSEQVKRVTVYEQAGKWYASVLFEAPDFTPPVHENQEGAVGVDLGSRKLAVAYDGQTLLQWENPKALESADRRLKRWQRRAARRGVRDKKGRVITNTRGLQEANGHIARLHKRVADIRRWHHHDLSHRLTQGYGIVGTEDLNVKGLMGGRSARVLADAGMGEKLRQISYKAQWRGGERRQVGRFFPSSKTCSDCGHKNDKLGAQERWACPNCGVVHDRDENAAINIYSETVGGSTP